MLSLWSDNLRYNRNSVSFDFTGFTTYKIDRKKYDCESGHIFLTALVTYVGNLMVPIGLVQSERSDAAFFYFFLSDWTASGAMALPELVTDMGKALQNAACSTFNQMSFRKYNNERLNTL